MAAVTLVDGADEDPAAEGLGAPFDGGVDGFEGIARMAARRARYRTAKVDRHGVRESTDDEGDDGERRGALFDSAEGAKHREAEKVSGDTISGGRRCSLDFCTSANDAGGGIPPEIRRKIRRVAGPATETFAPKVGAVWHNSGRGHVTFSAESSTSDQITWISDPPRHAHRVDMPGHIAGPTMSSEHT